MKKDLAIGYDSFLDLIGNHCYYVDKTRFVKVVMHDKSKVLLITRPRRFGKTLFMDTLNNFLRIGIDGSSDITERRRLFEGLEILKDAEFCKTYMCQCPTIFLSLKSAEGSTFQEAYQAFARILVGIARSFGFLSDSKNLSSEELLVFNRYRNLAQKTTNQGKHLVVITAFHGFRKRYIVLVDKKNDLTTVMTRKEFGHVL